MQTDHAAHLTLGLRLSDALPPFLESGCSGQGPRFFLNWTSALVLLFLKPEILLRPLPLSPPPLHTHTLWPVTSSWLGGRDADWEGAQEILLEMHIQQVEYKPHM